MKPVIFGCAGPTLSDEERQFFADEQPAGFILFTRNTLTPQQVLTLTTDLKLCVDRSDVLILIDQEGGRVQRMGPPNWRALPCMMTYGAAAHKEIGLAERALKLHCQIIADDLRRVGVNVDCLPLLDVPVPGADDVIGDRAFDEDREIVTRLGRLTNDTLLQSGILPVIKHLPGHGRSTVDSHLDLPRVSTSLETLKETDFPPFIDVADSPFGMTAHIIYEAIDDQNTATHSKAVVEKIIRDHIGFHGLLMTDDLSMRALTGSMESRTTRAIDAGCDLILHCNGKMDEMKAIASVLEPAPSSLQPRLASALQMVQNADTFDRQALERDFDRALADLEKL